MFKQNFDDQVLQCVECGVGFNFSAEDQEFYQQKRYSSPKRCPGCRANRKMQDNRGPRGGGRPQRQQFKAICAACGIDTTVPFEPKSDRPVYCSDCYRSQQHIDKEIILAKNNQKKEKAERNKANAEKFKKRVKSSRFGNRFNKDS